MTYDVECGDPFDGWSVTRQNADGTVDAIIVGVERAPAQIASVVLNEVERMLDDLEDSLRPVKLNFGRN
jgi:hypothetical protein